MRGFSSISWSAPAAAGEQKIDGDAERIGEAQQRGSPRDIAAPFHFADLEQAAVDSGSELLLFPAARSSQTGNPIRDILRCKLFAFPQAGPPLP